MKKIICILLTLVMAICLVNLNNNYTRADDDEEEINENEVIEIHNTNELITFIEKKVTSAKAKLVKDITYKTGATEEVRDVDLRGTKTIDLNGYSITFKECLSLGVKSTKKSSNHTLNIINTNTKQESKLRASKDLFGIAMIATRLYNKKIPIKTIVNIGLAPQENAKNGKIVFDGRNVSGVIGVVSGYHSLSHDKGYYDNNLSEININSRITNDNGYNVMFKNFKSNSDLTSMALACADGILNVNGAVIKDSDIGIASGRLDSVAYTGQAETVVNNSNITGCGIGVANGKYIGGLLFEEIEPNDVYVNNSTITKNDIGVQFHKEKEDVVRNETNGLFVIDSVQGNGDSNNSSIIENGVDYYCSGTDAVFGINKIDKQTTFKADLDFWEEAITYNIPVATVSETTYNIYLYSMNEGLYAHLDSNDEHSILLSAIPDDSVKPIHEAGDMKVVDGGFVASFTKSNASKAIAHIDGISYVEGITQVNVFDVDKMEYLTKDYEFSCEAGSTKVIFNKYFINSLSTGEHNYVIFINDGITTSYNYPFYVTIKISDDTPSPKKDESCEKVIGPTWHWNNEKGICEDVGVVGTYTR